jgi:hypothetical protein
MDTFYDTSKLSLQQKIELLNDCKAVCCNWWIDMLDCSQIDVAHHSKIWVTACKILSQSFATSAKLYANCMYHKRKKDLHFTASP